MNAAGLRTRLLRPALALAGCVLAATALAEDPLDARRAAFREAWPAAERGDWAPAAEHLPLLESYVLWPDLRAAWLKAKLGSVDEAEVRTFLDTWGDAKPARELRYAFALRLAADERWEDYLELYRRHYGDAGSARLDCLAARAGILSGRQQEFAGLARGLWLVGRSQADECDPVFDYLRGAGLLDAGLVRDRFELAIQARQFSLARYLARSIDGGHLEEADRWRTAGEDPQAFLTADAACDDGDKHRAQLLYALERVAWNEATRAHELWRTVSGTHDFRPREAARITRYIALSAGQQHRREAFELLTALEEDAVDSTVRAWQVRAALLRHDWRNVLAVIDDMPAAERQEPEWRYWRAIALLQSGDEAGARPILRELARSRGYFAFLAADELDVEYAFGHAPTPEDEAAVERLARNPALVRARELYYVGLESRGRSEWAAALRELEPALAPQAALLAHRWTWHSQAIVTLADSERYDDLELRYPLPYPDEFLASADAAAIRGSWAYGIARSESLFMADVRSHAGAVGLMQLMPATGRRTAAELDLPWSGLETLTDPISNIRLGTAYLGKMLERFGGNLVLATAAYNAGPHKVEEWLPAPGRPLDARIWIENIPYNETRAFVRRVLAADTIFHWRLTGRAARLSAELRAVGAIPLPERVSRLGGDGREDAGS